MTAQWRIARYGAVGGVDLSKRDAAGRVDKRVAPGIAEPAADRCLPGQLRVEATGRRKASARRHIANPGILDQAIVCPVEARSLEVSFGSEYDMTDLPIVAGVDPANNTGAGPFAGVAVLRDYVVDTTSL